MRAVIVREVMKPADLSISQVPPPPTEARKIAIEVKAAGCNFADTLIVPVQSVTEHEHEHYAYTYDGKGFNRNKVKIGESNEKMVEILDGLKQGMMVALDARTRGSEDFQENLTSDEPEIDRPIPPEPPAAAQPPTVTASAGT